jgi:uncharacterized membrane protein
MAVSSIGGIESAAQVAQHPLHPMLVPFPIAFLIATWACDLAFWASGNPFWANVAVWALGAGVVTGAVAAVAGLADFLGSARIRALTEAWQHFLGNAAILVLAFINLYLRCSATAVDAAVLPAGIVLSTIVAGMLLYTGWKGGEMVYRHRVGVRAMSPFATMDVPSETAAPQWPPRPA